MQIFKKRLSVHRTSRNLRNIWDEYALQITAEGGQERDSSRLLALSSFMDNIFDVGQPLPLEPTALGLTFNFDDTAVVIVGLLNVARRASIQLLAEEIPFKDGDVDRTTLAVRKALMVAKLCLKKCVNREHIKSVASIPHIVSLILAILENVANIEDKTLSLQILCYILQYEETKLELCRLGGLKLLCSLAADGAAVGADSCAARSGVRKKLHQQIVTTLRLCLTPSSSSSSSSSVSPGERVPPQFQALKRSSSINKNQSRSTSSDKLSPRSSAPPAATTRPADSPLLSQVSQMSQHSSASFDLHSLRTHSSESTGADESRSHQRGGEGQGSWPPLRPLYPHPRTHSHSLQQEQQQQQRPHPEHSAVQHPSASLAAKGANMAVTVVNEILRLTPMASSASWLQSGLADNLSGEAEARRRDLLHLNGGGTELAEQQQEEEEEEEQEGAHFGGLDITPPRSWRDHERHRLEDAEADAHDVLALKDEDKEASSTGIGMDQHEFSLNAATAQELAAMIICFLEEAAAAVAVGENNNNDSGTDNGNGSGDEQEDLLCAVRDQISLLLCAMKLLLRYKTARDYFLRSQGYDALGALVAVVVAEVGLNDFSQYCEGGKRKEDSQRVPSTGDGDHDEAHDNCPGDVHMSVTTVLMSLLFGQLITAEGMERCGDVSCAAAVRSDLLVKNNRVLSIIVHSVESSSVPDIAVGLNALECMLRLSPLAVIALENSGGLVAVGRVVARKSLAATVLRDDYHLTATATANAAATAAAEANGTTVDFSVLQCASNVLVKVAVLNAEVSVEVLAFFTCLLRENALFHHRCLSSHPSSSPTSPDTATASVQRCTNCETEAAVFECTDGSCIRDDMFALCVECDKVFHKSVLKRSHIRIPMMDHSSDSAALLFESMPGEGAGLQAVVEEERAGAENSSSSSDDISSSAREMWGGAGEGGKGGEGAQKNKKELLAQASCLLLSHVKSILNDRQVRMLKNPVEVLDAVLDIFRCSLMVIANPGPKSGSGSGGSGGEAGLYMGADLQHTALRHAADHPVQSSVCLGLLLPGGRERESEEGQQGQQGSSSAQGQCSAEEPPETMQFRAQRIFLSLCLQIIARFFVRAEALFALAIVKNDGGRILLTAADKQFALWTLREVCIAAFEAEISEGGSLMIWWGWLLHCPVIRSHDSPASSTDRSRKAKAKDSRGCQKRQQAWSACLAAATREAAEGQGQRQQGRRGDSSPGGLVGERSCCLPPLEHREVSAQVRLFVLQEVRLLLGGEAWDPVLASAAGIPAKLCRCSLAPPPPHSQSPAASATHARGGDEESQSQQAAAAAAVYFRIPTSKQAVQAGMLRAGVLPALLDQVAGDLAPPAVLHRLQQQPPQSPQSQSQPRGPPAEHASSSGSKQGGAPHDLDIEEWWSALNALSSLVTQCSPAKQQLDEYLGVLGFTKLLLPLLQRCCCLGASSQAKRLGVALSDFILELSVHGTLCSLARPFRQWCTVAAIQQHHSHSQTQLLLSANPSSAFSDRIVAPFSTLNSSHADTLADFSCSYVLKESSCRQMAACLKPHTIFLHPSSYGRLGLSNSGGQQQQRSNSSCLEGRSSSIKGGGDRRAAGTEFFSEHYSQSLDDRSSTGRGSFSLQMSLHGGGGGGISRVYSQSTIYTPTPSVTGGGGDAPAPSFEEYGVGYGHVYGAGGGGGGGGGGGSRQQGGGQGGQATTTVSMLSVSHKGGYGFEDPGDSGGHPSNYTGLFLPMAAALRWGLAHRRNLILRIVYETLLLRSEEGGEAGQGREGAGLLMSLRKQSIEQYLQSFLSVEASAGSQSRCAANGVLRRRGRGGGEQERDHAPDGSVSPTCVFRSPQVLVNLFSLYLVLSAGTAGGNGGGSDVPGRLLRTVSHLVDGNPLNAELMQQHRSRSLALNLSRFVFSHHSAAYPRASVCHILSQIFSYKVTANVFNCLVDTASASASATVISGAEEQQSAGPSQLTIATKGVSQCRDAPPPDLDAAGFSILYLLGRALEQAPPTSYAHFSQACPFLSRVVLPPLRPPLCPPRQQGLSAFLWLRLGNLCDAPNATLLQFSMDHPLRYHLSSGTSSAEDGVQDRSSSSSSSSSSKDKDKEGSGASPSAAAAHSIDFYFRVVHQTGISLLAPGGARQAHPPSSSSLHTLTHLPPEVASVASGTHTTAAHTAVEEVQRSFVQLCASYSDSESRAVAAAAVLHKEKGEGKGEPATDDSLDTDTNDALGLNGEIVSSLVKYSAPDVIIDYEWHEMGDWHSLCLSLTAGGVTCCVDGVPRRTLYWTALGYVDADEAPPNIRYPEVAHNQVLQPVLGGIIHEQYAYMDSMQSLKSLAERCNEGLQAAQEGAQEQQQQQRAEEEEERLRRELDLLQSYSELVRGMSGYVGGLLLLAGVPDREVIAAAHSQGGGAESGDMAHLFPGQKPLCSFVPSNFSGGGGSSSQVPPESPSVSGRCRQEKVGGHMDITSPSLSAHMGTEQRQHQQQQHSRGRQHSPSCHDHDFMRGGGSGGAAGSSGSGSVRLSRSLSPNNSRHQSSSLSRALQGEVHRAASSSSRHRHQQESRQQQEQEQQEVPRLQAQHHSLVSDILTMFARPDKERLHDTTNKDSQSNSSMYVEGSVLIRSANNLAESMCSFARGGGGLRVWFPLLIMDAPRQVAVLRILGSLFAASAQVRTQFEALSLSSVLLYSMYVTPLLASEASLQVLFDLATLPALPHTQPQQAKHEAIHRVEFLVLAVQIATSSPCNIQLALCTVEWLIGLCDDSLENIATVLEAVGVVPFLLMLSLWLTCEDMQLAEAEEVGGVSEYTVRMPCAALTGDEEARLLKSSRGIFSNDSIYSDQPKKLAKLQVTVARLLKLLITGANGELPPLRVAASAQTPSGFSVPHLQALLHFIAHTMDFSLSESQVAKSTKDSSRDTTEPSRPRAQDSHCHSPTSGTSANWTSFFSSTSSSSSPRHPQSSSLHACQLALDCIIYPSEGPLGGTIIAMLKSALPGNELWYMIIHLLACADAAIKARALHLLGLSLSTLEGQIDHRQVALLEKVGGFRCIADTFSGFSGDSEAILGELFSLFFWRRSGSRGMFAYTSMGTGSTASSHGRSSGQSQSQGQSPPTRRPPPAPPASRTLAEPSTDAAGGSSSIFSMFSWMSKPEKTGEEPIAMHSSAPIPITSADSQQQLQQHGKHKAEGGGENGVAHSNNSGSSGEDLGTFRSISCLDGGEEEEQEQGQHHSPPPPPVPSLPVHVQVETIVLPQLLQAILKILENEPRPDRVEAAVWSIEQALCPPSSSAPRPPHSHLPPLRPQGERQGDGGAGTRASREREAAEAAASTLSHNMDVLTGEKSPEWLLWIYHCLEAFKRRDAQELLQDGGGGFLSMSEGGSGVESGEDLVEMDDSQHSQHSLHRRPRPTSSSPLSVQQQRGHTHSLLTRYSDSLLALVQAVMRIDMVRKPSSSRKLYDILSLPAPEAREQQLAILLDLLQSVNHYQQSNHDYNTCMNLLRNLSAFLEKVLMKCEISLEFCVKAVHTLDSLVYRAPPDVRNKVKDTLLPEVRNTYVTYCLVQRAESVWPRITALAEIHSSVLNLVLSGETRSLYDHHVFLLLLELLLQASALNIEDDEMALDSSNCRSEENCSSQMNFERQVAVVVLVQNCCLASPDCRRCAEKMFMRMNEHSPHLAEVSGVIMQAFLNTFVDNNNSNSSSRGCVSPDFAAYKSPPSSSQAQQQQQRTSWWGALVGSNSISEVPPDTTAQNQEQQGLPTGNFVILAGEGGRTSSVTATVSDSGCIELCDLENPTPSSLTEQQQWEEDAPSHKEEEEDEEGEEEEDTPGPHHQSLPHDTASFVDWFNAPEQRGCVDTLNVLLPKLLEPAHRQGDKLLEKLVQKQGQHNVKLQGKRAKEKALLGRGLKELLQKTRSSGEKRRARHQQEAHLCTSQLKKQILAGAEEFKSCLEEASSCSSATPFTVQEQEEQEQEEGGDDAAPPCPLTFSEVYEELILDL